MGATSYIRIPGNKNVDSKVITQIYWINPSTIFFLFFSPWISFIFKKIKYIFN